MGLQRFFIALVILAATPLAASALTLDEIKAQLLSMLEHVSMLKLELEQRKKIAPPLPLNLPCLSLGRTLRIGVEGEDVEKLQELLIGAGLLAKGKATGYFGTLTQAAVQKWQAAAGIVSSGSPAGTGFGVVGPKTRDAILAACKNNLAASHALSVRSCPGEPSAPTRACARSWQKGLDASGCVTGYVCWEDQNSVHEGAVAAPRIIIVEPSLGATVTGGNTLTISWRSENVPKGAVSLTLHAAAGERIGEIAHGLALSGQYLWRVPKTSTDCSQGESAFDCIEKFALCDGGSSICSLTPGTYRVRLSNESLASDSAPFRIADTDISAALQDIVGAPILQQSSLNTVPEATGNPAEVGTTSSQYLEVDVGAAYSTTSSAIQSGYTSRCPQEGWRAYLACPYGGCTTGWNVCRGGIWVLDSAQQIYIVGTQGPCASGEVWCGVGTGYQCVANSACMNGNAL